MKTLSIKQPWAWLIVNGYKPVENRSWATNFRGEVLIHAGKTFDWTALEFLHESFPDLLDKVVKEFQISSLKPWHVCPNKIGGIVGKAEIVGCVTEYDSPWFFGPYGFVLKNPQPLPFVPCRGQLGFFEVKP